jgi:hypothetical protein
LQITFQEAACMAASLYCVPNMFDSLGVQVPHSTWWR